MNNLSGINPVGPTVLILTDTIGEVSKGGIILGTDSQIEREQMAQTEGVVIALGSLCWADEPTPRCKVGDKVVFAKYAGMLREVEKEDGKLSYRLVNDNDIRAVLIGENDE